MRRSKLTMLVLACAVALTVPVGCTVDSEETPVSSEEEAKVTILYSGCDCGPLWDDLTETYESINPVVDFRRGGHVHCANAIQGVYDGVLDMASVAAYSKVEGEDRGLVFTPLCKDALVMAVSHEVGVVDLTREQIQAIYSGEYSNWSELGGSDLPIYIVDRDEYCSSRLAAERWILGEGLVVSNAVVVAEEVDIIDLIEGAPGTIGYFSAGLGNWVGTSLQYLAIDGVSPTAENVLDGSYTAVRERGFVTGPDSPEVLDDFIEWLGGPEAIQIVEQDGYLSYDE